uniref:Putative triple gene block protein 2 n=1 Tax=Escobaria virus TaxID=1417306 RepID=V5V1S5_9VIRU|nr:putative triple gene block protein 2 [Escobaria virus]
MSFTPPPDYTKPILCGLICTAATFCTFLLTRNNLPHSGDNLHHLPFGGVYQDGNKFVRYAGPSKQLGPTHPQVLAVIVSLTLAIYLLSACRRPNRAQCQHCSRS